MGKNFPMWKWLIDWFVLAAWMILIVFWTAYSLAGDCVLQVRDAECRIFCLRGGWDSGKYAAVSGDAPVCECIDEIEYSKATEKSFRLGKTPVFRKKQPWE